METWITIPLQLSSENAAFSKCLNFASFAKFVTLLCTFQLFSISVVSKFRAKVEKKVKPIDTRLIFYWCCFLFGCTEPQILSHSSYNWTIKTSRKYFLVKHSFKFATIIGKDKKNIKRGGFNRKIGFYHEKISPLPWNTSYNIMIRNLGIVTHHVPEFIFIRQWCRPLSVRDDTTYRPLNVPVSIHTKWNPYLVFTLFCI